MTPADTIISILCKQFGMAPDEIARNNKIIKDLGADSLDCVEMMITAEDEFGIDIPDSEAVKIVTVGDAIALAERLTAGR